MAKTNSYNSGMRILKTLEYLHNLKEPKRGEQGVKVQPTDLARFLKKECGEKATPETVKEILNAIIDSDTGYLLQETKSRGGQTQYWYRRTFTLEQISLLSSIISSSMFLDEAEINVLLERLKTLTSDDNADEVSKSEHFLRPRMTNTDALDNLRKIHEAINTRQALRFLPGQMDIRKRLYFDKPIRGKKSKVQRVTLTENGRIIEEIDNPTPNRDAWIVCSPYALAWDNSRCYLIGGITDMRSVYDYSDTDKNKDTVRLWNFRVDRMFHLEIFSGAGYRVPLSTPYYTPDDSKDKDTPISELFLAEQYLHSVFKMFTSSHIVPVTLRFKHKLTRVIVEKFGFDVDIIPENEQYAHTTVKVQVSQQFYGWLAGFHAEDLSLISPEAEITSYVDYLNKTIDHYNMLSRKEKGNG